MFTPFAVELYLRYLNGETIAELSAELGIPLERIEDRIRAAEAYVTRQVTVAA
jgi:DNA-directed RNA polymerase specialized sigma24 family protein